MSDDTLDVNEVEDTEPAATAPSGAGKAEKPAKVGFFARIGQRISGFFSRLFRPELVNLKTAGVGLVVVLAIWLLLANLSPVRVVLWFWTVDVPKLFLFIFDVALGAALMWLWVRFRGRRKPAGGGEGAK